MNTNPVWQHVVHAAPPSSETLRQIVRRLLDDTAAWMMSRPPPSTESLLPVARELLEATVAHLMGEPLPPPGPSHSAAVKGARGDVPPPGGGSRAEREG